MEGWTRCSDKLPQVIAKLASLVRRGLMDGCTCGCRGDFFLTTKGRERLLGLDPMDVGSSPPMGENEDFLRDAYARAAAMGRQADHEERSRAVMDRRCPDCHAELEVQEVRWRGPFTPVTILRCTDCRDWYFNEPSGCGGGASHRQQ